MKESFFAMIASDNSNRLIFADWCDENDELRVGVHVD